MYRLWRHSWFVCVALFLTTGALGLSGADLPFQVVDTEGQWRAVPVQQEVAPGILCEMIITRMGSGDRLLVLSAPRTDEGDGPLRAFAERVKGAFVAYQSTVLADESTAQMGFVGRRLRLDLVSESDAMECELFVFADEHASWWGVLHTKPKGAPVEAASAFRVLQKNVPVPADVVGMTPFRVREDPISNFPISFEIIRNRGADRIVGIEVTFVPEDSSTERVGVRVGDVVVAINGRRTEDFTTGVGKESELGRIFLNRRPGDEVRLELRRPGVEKTFHVTLRVPRNRDPWAQFR